MSTPMNVSEIWPVYDTLIVSQFLHGAESKTPGWFGATLANPTARPIEEFASRDKHIFFKSGRTEGNSHLAYNNQQSSETMDFAYRLYSLGIRFWGPVSAMEGGYWSADTTYRELRYINSYLAQFWKTDLVRNCGIDFKVEQDTIVEGPCFTCPPGHGHTASGVAWSDPVTPVLDVIPTAAGNDQLIQYPQMINVVSQGIPVIGNRFNFSPPLEIPRGALIEANVYLSQYARYVLHDVQGPMSYLFNRVCARIHDLEEGETDILETNPLTWFGCRYGITVSLIGERLVQQRGQYHAPLAIET